MRRLFEQFVVDATDVFAMLVEGLLWGLPTALMEIGEVLRPYLFEIILFGGLACLMLF
jgi:hypothetical protein